MRIINNYLLAKFLAFKRRLYILVFGEFDPYPDNPKKFSFSPSEFNQYESENIITKYGLKKDTIDINNWKLRSKKKYSELLRIKNNLYFKIIHETSMPIKKNFDRKRIYIEFSKFRHAPIDIISKKSSSFNHIVICMQGTNSGAHLNLDEIRMPADVKKVINGSGLAIQAVEEGYLAVSYERIGFGERREQKLNINKNNSQTIYESERAASFHSLLLGNTLLGETVKELMLITRWLKKEYNNKIIWLVGYSAAGTTALAAATVDDNIDGVAVGGCVGFSKETILKRVSSGLNAIPNMMEWLDYDAQIALISPKPCIIIAGENDHIWPYKGAQEVVNSSKKIYKIDNSKNNLMLIKGSRGHTYYPDLMWPEVAKFLK